MTSWHPSRALLLLLVIGAIGAGGCGSGAGSTTTRAGHGPGFMAQLNAACRADRAATRRAAKTGAAQAAAQQAFLHTLLTLKPPHPLKPTYSEYISVLQLNLAAFERHDIAASKRLETEIARVVAKLRNAGATSC